jgi:hypothetical protein
MPEERETLVNRIAQIFRELEFPELTADQKASLECERISLTLRLREDDNRPTTLP